MNRSAPRTVYQDTPELEKARAAYMREDYSASLRIFERAVKRQPNNILALTDAARAFGQRYEIEKAAKLVKRMLTIGSRNPQVCFLAGQTMRMIHRADEALQHLGSAARHNDISPDVYLELGVLLERRHRLDEAMEQVNRYLAHDAENPEAMLLKARILRRSGQPEDAEEIYHGLSCRTGCSHLTKAQTLNEWANMLDSQSDYKGAWQKLIESKSLITKLPETAAANARCDQEHAWLRRFSDSVTADHLGRWSDRQSSTAHRSVLLTGCPRSGTTLIEKILDAHPEILSADELGAFTSYILPSLVKGKRDKEGFFDAETLDQVSPGKIKREEKRYFRYLQGALNEEIGDRILVDKNPSVTFMIPAHQRVWPDNKILYALRDPRDVALSCFFRWLPINSMSVRFHSLEDTCKRCAEELECWLKLREILPEDAWHETRYENTVADYAGEASKVLKWMGLEWQPAISDYRRHMEKRVVNSPSYDVVHQPIYQTAQGRWKNYQEHFAPVMEHLNKSLSAYDYE